MTTFKRFSAALILAAAVATPVAAQQAIQNAGSSRPADAMDSQRSGDLAGMQMAVRPHKTLAVRAHAKRY
jgi:hypothetical protein